MLKQWLVTQAISQMFFGFFFFFLGNRGIVHPPSDDEGTERRTRFEPEQRCLSSTTSYISDIVRIFVSEAC